MALIKSALAGGVAIEPTNLAAVNGQNLTGVEVGAYYYISLLCSAQNPPTITGADVLNTFTLRTSNSSAGWHEYCAVVKATATTITSSSSLYAAGSIGYIKLT
jgi:hypothetical protein